MTHLRITLDWRMVLLFCVGFGWIIATRIPDSRPITHTTGARMPSLDLQLLDGTPQNTASLIGAPVVVTIWASWCPTCRAAMPFWERNAADFAHKGVTLIALNQREALQTVQRAQAEFPPNLTVWSDPNGLFLQFLQSTDLPTTAFIDRSGHVVSVVRGPVSGAVVTAMIDQLTSDK